MIEKPSESQGLLTFKDRHGREWDLTITLGGAYRVESSDYSEIYTGAVSLIKPTKEFFTTAITNTPLTFAIIWTIVKPQADKQEVTEAEFIESLDGQTLETGQEIFWEALISFFPQAKTALSALIKQYKKARSQITAGLAKMEGKIEKTMTAATKEQLALAENELDKIIDGLDKSGVKSLASSGSSSSPNETG